MLRHGSNTSNTQLRRSHSALRVRISARTQLASGTAPALLFLLKAYKPSAAQSVTVGIIGLPAIGKSSLIKMLKRAKVCAVVAQPGHMKELQSVQLERDMWIVDSPGVIFRETREVALLRQSKSTSHHLVA